MPRMFTEGTVATNDDIVYEEQLNILNALLKTSHIPYSGAQTPTSHPDPGLLMQDQPVLEYNSSTSSSDTSLEPAETGSESPNENVSLKGLPFHLKETSIRRPKTSRRKGHRMSREERRKRNREAAERTRKRKVERFERMEHIIRALYRQNQELTNALNGVIQESKQSQCVACKRSLEARAGALSFGEQFALGHVHTIPE